MILAGDVAAGDVIVFPDVRDAVLVKQSAWDKTGSSFGGAWPAPGLAGTFVHRGPVQAMAAGGEGLQALAAIRWAYQTGYFRGD